MKNVLIILLSLLTSACHSSVTQPPNSNQQDTIIYQVDIAQTKIDFIYFSNQHKIRAFVSPQMGQFVFVSGRLISADLIIDMNTLGADGKDSMQKAIRTTELMDTNCFSVARYPLCQFNLLSALSIPTSSIIEKLTMDCTHQIQGDLMMKGINKRIAFPAKLLLHDRTLSLDAYPQLRLQDWLIVGVSDHVGFTPMSIHLVAHRQ